MDQLTSFINNEELFAQIGELYTQMLSSFPMVLSVALALVLVAIYSYRIFRLELSVSGAVGCGALGYIFLAPFLLDKLPTVEWIDLAAVIGVVCAILGWVLIYALHKVSLFLCGAAIGFYAGIFVASFLALNFTDVALLQNEVFFYVVCGICALACGIIFVFLFKLLYILITSFGGMIGACYLISLSVFNEMNPPILYGTLAVGAVLGIIASVVQFKKASEHT